MATRLQTIVVELTGAAQQLTGAGLVRSLALQPRGTNTNPVYLGSSSAVTSTNYGVRLPAPSGGIPPAPYIPPEFTDGTVALTDFWVIGTAGEFLHLHVLPYLKLS